MDWDELKLAFKLYPGGFGTPEPCSDDDLDRFDERFALSHQDIPRLQDIAGLCGFITLALAFALVIPVMFWLSTTPAYSQVVNNDFVAGKAFLNAVGIFLVFPVFLVLEPVIGLVHLTFSYRDSHVSYVQLVKAMKVARAARERYRDD
jgi:hypothetical protein